MAGARWTRACFAVGVVTACRSGGSGTPSPVEPSGDGGLTDATAVAAPANALNLPGAMIDAVVNPMHLPAYSGPTGSVEGTVLVRGPDAPDVPDLDVHACPAALDTYGKLFRAGPRRADGARPLADAIVVVTGYSGFYVPEPSEVARASIGAGCGYTQRSIAMTFGQRLEIDNDSPLSFAPYLEGAPRLTVMIAAPRRHGEPVKIFPARADYFVLRDQMQPFVRGDVYVLRQPLHAVSDAQGHFRIDGVPVGALRIGAHLAAVLGDAVADVDVAAGAAQHVELVLTYAPGDGGSAATRASGPPATRAR
jgi:hypothetical protein